MLLAACWTVVRYVEISGTGRYDTNLAPDSRRNGPTRTSACDAEPLLPSRIESTIVGTAETSFVGHVQAKPFPFHI